MIEFCCDLISLNWPKFKVHKVVLGNTDLFVENSCLDVDAGTDETFFHELAVFLWINLFSIACQCTGLALCNGKS